MGIKKPLDKSNPPVEKKVIIIVILLLIFVIVGVSGYMFGAKKATQTAAPSKTQSIGLQSFSKLGVSFQYPEQVKIVEESSNEGTSATTRQNIVKFNIDGKEFVFGKMTAFTEEEAPYNQTDLTEKFNGISWKVVLPSQTSEYCDGGECGQTAPSYYVHKNGYRYSFTYYSDDLQQAIEEILATFAFQEE